MYIYIYSDSQPSLFAASAQPCCPLRFDTAAATEMEESRCHTAAGTQSHQVYG